MSSMGRKKSYVRKNMGKTGGEIYAKICHLRYLPLYVLLALQLTMPRN